MTVTSATNLLTTSTEPLVTLSTGDDNQTQNPQNQRTTLAVHQQAAGFSVPYFLTLSNSAPTVVSSNENSFIIVQRTTIAEGPLFWPVITLMLTLSFFMVWLGIRRRKES
jgi:hypothetical protein